MNSSRRPRVELKELQRSMKVSMCSMLMPPISVFQRVETSDAITFWGGAFGCGVGSSSGAGGCWSSCFLPGLRLVLSFLKWVVGFMRLVGDSASWPSSESSSPPSMTVDGSPPAVAWLSVVRAALRLGPGFAGSEGRGRFNFFPFGPLSSYREVIFGAGPGRLRPLTCTAGTSGVNKGGLFDEVGGLTIGSYRAVFFGTFSSHPLLLVMSFRHATI